MPHLGIGRKILEIAADPQAGARGGSHLPGHRKRALHLAVNV